MTTQEKEAKKLKAKEEDKKRSEMLKNIDEDEEQTRMQKLLAVKPESKAIIFDNEQGEDEGYKNKRKNKTDAKTKKYLELIQQF